MREHGLRVETYAEHFEEKNVPDQRSIARVLARQTMEAFIATVRRSPLPGGSFKADVEISLTFRQWVLRRGVAFPESDDLDF